MSETTSGMALKTGSFTVDLPGNRKNVDEPTDQYLSPMSALNFFGGYTLW